VAYTNHGPPTYTASGYYYDYYYYPYTSVYFHISTGEYYYRTDGSWHRSRTLPRNIYIDPRDRVKLRISDPKPYAHNSERRAQHRVPSYHYQPNPVRNRQERQHNVRRHEEYRRSYGR